MPVVAGPDTGPVPSARRPGTTVVGVSFRPGAAPALLGIPADELRDLRVPLTDVWGSDAAPLERGVDDASPPSVRHDLIERQLRRRLVRAERPDDVVAAAVARLRRPGRRRVRTLGDELGISERQLLRRFDAAVGYGPKTLDRVLQFQRFLSSAPLVAKGEARLARIAAELGYADQAHLSRECARLSGVTPQGLVANRPA